MLMNLLYKPILKGKRLNYFKKFQLYILIIQYFLSMHLFAKHQHFSSLLYKITENPANMQQIIYPVIKH